MISEGVFNAISGAFSVFGGYMGGSAGLHNTVFTKLLSKKGDFLARLFIENVALPLKMYILSFKSQIWRID